jgi:hypothetical protein
VPRKQKKYHYIYKTTCIITEKFYIGMHSTDNLYDDYLGSGKILRLSINKYGTDHHILEILEFHDNRKALAAREKEIVNEELVIDCICMNLKVGGIGGAVIGHTTSEETKRKIGLANSKKRGQISGNKGKRGQIPWNKGMKGFLAGRKIIWGDKISKSKTKVTKEALIEYIKQNPTSTIKQMMEHFKVKTHIPITKFGGVKQLRFEVFGKNPELLGPSGNLLWKFTENKNKWR